MDILLLGPPGSGKGTQAKLLTKEIGLKHLSTGDLFRENISNDTPLGQKVKAIMAAGQLVGDDITNAMVDDKLKSESVKGYIFDGYPRTLNQIEPLDEMLKELDRKLDKVIMLDLPLTELEKRLVGRRVCPKCKTVYHIDYAKPKKDNVCDHDGETLSHRSDDQKDKVQVRINEYLKLTEPLVEAYGKRGILFKVDANQTTEDVLRSIVEVING